jgi:hypothetical protein
VSYEVYIDVRHHPKHNEDYEQRESTCFKFSDGKEPLEHVVNGLREFADAIDPSFMCSHCGVTRGEHIREGNLYRCFNQYGPITQHAWWRRLGGQERMKGDERKYLDSVIAQSKQRLARIMDLEDALRGAQWCLQRASTIHVTSRDLPTWRKHREFVDETLEHNPDGEVKSA